MLVTLALLVFCSAIFVFFSKEFGQFFKKIFSIPGTKLFIPLLFATWLIIAYEPWERLIILWFQTTTHRVIHYVSQFIPLAKWAISLTWILFLLVLACLPVWIAHFRNRKMKHQGPQPFTYWVGFLLWVIAVILLAVPTI